MNKQQILITGANRGIGLALVREFLERRGASVLATCRDRSRAPELEALADSHSDALDILEMDLDEDASVAAAAASWKDRGGQLDLLIFNAGTNAKGDSRITGIGGIERAPFRGILETNAVSQVMAVQTFLPLLRTTNRPGVVFISSQMGSIELAMAGRVNAYSVSKAALNMVAAGLARELRPRGIPVLTMHPGHVATDMGGAGALSIRRS